MTRVWDQSAQKGSTLLLLLALADHAADDGFCWPGYKTLAQKIRMTERSVARKVQALEEAGELYVIRKTGEHHWYVVRVGMSDEDVIATLKKRKMDTPDNLSPLTHVSTPPDNTDGRPLTKLCHTNRNEPSSNRQKDAQGALPPDDCSDLWAGTTTKGPSGDREIPSGNVDPIRHGLEARARIGNKKSWTVTGPEGANDWAGQPVAEFCALIGLPYKRLPDSRKTYFADELQRLAEEVHANPAQVCRAIRAIATDESRQWLRSAGRPHHAGFANALQNVLCGLDTPRSLTDPSNGPHIAPSDIWEDERATTAI